MLGKHSIIDTTKLHLIYKLLNDKKIKRINKSLNKIFSKLPYNAKELIKILDRFNDPSFSVQNLPEYSIGNRESIIIKNDNDLLKCVNHIKSLDFVGFDTEQKPTFVKGEKQKDISIIQIASGSRCYIIQVKFIKNRKILNSIFGKEILKVGFDLKNDNKEITSQFNTNLENILDLSTFIKTELLHQNKIGAKNAVGLILNKQLQKSKNTALSNWENDELTNNQIKYALEDATAPFDVYDFLLEKFPSIIN